MLALTQSFVKKVQYIYILFIYYFFTYSRRTVMRQIPLWAWVRTIKV